MKPPPQLTTSQWADRERYLSPESSAEPGKWITDRAPYAREPMDEITNPRVHTVVLCWSSQVGKSEVLLNGQGYFIDQDPCPQLMLQPTLDMAEAYSKDRLAPMIRDTPALRAKVKDVRSRDSGNTLLQKKFPGGHLTIAGANSPASLAMRPVRVVWMDERDRFPESAGTEGDPCALAEKRSSTFYNRKTIKVSSPSKKKGGIKDDYDASDQRVCLLPCPHCGTYQQLKFGNLEWEGDDIKTFKPETVRMLCIECREPIDDAEKGEMLARLKWVAQAPFNGVAGFFLNELYSPWRRWWQVVEDFLKKKDKPDQLRVWKNTALAEIYEEKGEAPEWKQLYDRREHYRMGTVPYGVLFLTAGADVQKNRIEVEVVGWGFEKESWSIAYRVIEGDTSTPEPWAKLDELLREEFPHVSGELTMPIVRLAVDSGFNTQTVYSWARKYPGGRVMAVKGNDSLPMTVAAARTVDVRKSGKTSRRGFKYWPVGSSVVKSELYGWLHMPKPEDLSQPYPGFCHFPEYEEEYFKQITAEQQVYKKMKNGGARQVWEKTRDRNEALDCRVYARAAASAYGIDRFTKQQWERMSHAVPARPLMPVVPKEEPKAQEQPPPPSAPPPKPKAPLKRKKSSFL